MSFLSALDASKLMDAARADLQPLVDKAEDKALAALHVEVAAGLQSLITIASQFGEVLTKVFDGYQVTISISKKETP